MIHYQLSESELADCYAEGIRRQQINSARGYVPGNPHEDVGGVPRDEVNFYYFNAIGCVGELTCNALLGYDTQFIDRRREDYSKPDCGAFDVRTTVRHDGSLKIYPKDHAYPWRKMFLCSMQSENVCGVVGFLQVSEALIHPEAKRVGRQLWIPHWAVHRIFSVDEMRHHAEDRVHALG